MLHDNVDCLFKFLFKRKQKLRYLRSFWNVTTKPYKYLNITFPMILPSVGDDSDGKDHEKKDRINQYRDCRHISYGVLYLSSRFSIGSFF